MIAKLDIPPGVYNNSTEYGTGPRWYVADGMRWHAGVMKPLGGYHAFAAAQTSYADTKRNMVAWRDNSGNRFIAAGGPSKLEVSGDQMVHPSDLADITPAGFSTGNEDGSGDTRADTWYLDIWGQYLVACSTSDGKLYEWQLDYGTPTKAVAMSGAPTDCTALIVTDERFIFALGAGGDPRKVQWCDQGDNTDWTPTATNQAGSFLLETDGRILTAVRARGETLIFTDSGDIWAARYVGQPFVYSFERVGSGAAPIGPHAVVSIDDGVYWMGRGAFYGYDGRVKTIPCDVHRSTFHGDFQTQGSISDTNVDMEQRHKVWATTMQKYSEVWWLYPTDATETAFRYVSLNYKDGFWAMGSAEAPLFVDRGVYDYPVSIKNSASFKLYLDNDPGAAFNWWDTGTATGYPFARTSDIALLPDERWFHARWWYWDHGESYLYAKVYLYGSRYPGDWFAADVITGADNLDVQRVETRFTGRRLQLQVDAQGNRMVFGVPSLDIVPAGKR